jgi:hypothetical protein
MEVFCMKWILRIAMPVCFTLLLAAGVAAAGDSGIAPKAQADRAGKRISLYSDVFEDDLHYKDIEFVTEKGLFPIQGKAFNPDAPLLWDALAQATGKLVAANISCISDKERPYVAWASQSGILADLGLNLAADSELTKEQTAAILLAYANYAGKGPKGAWAIRLDYSDLKDISEKLLPGVMWCTLKGIMKADEGNSFEPKKVLMRAEGAAIVRKYADVLK